MFCVRNYSVLKSNQPVRHHALLVLAGCTAFGSGAYAQDATALLGQMRAAESTVQLSATQNTRRNGKQETAKIYRDGLKRRIEWLEPSVRRGDVMVDNGKTVWLYHHADNSTIQTNSTGHVPGYSGTWSVAKSGGDYVLKQANRELTIDGVHKNILRFENGKTIVGLSNVKYGGVDESKFSFSPPSDSKVTKIDGRLYYNLNAAKRAASWFKSPSQLPKFDFESAVVADNEVWLRYTDGTRRLSIFQQKAPGDNIKPQSVSGGWFWKTDGVRFLATGAPDSVIQSLSQNLK